MSKPVMFACRPLEARNILGIYVSEPEDIRWAIASYMVGRIILKQFSLSTDVVESGWQRSTEPQRSN